MLRPLRTHEGGRLRVAPLTVVLDAARWMELSAELVLTGERQTPARLEELADYLFSKQLEEAAVIALNKVDLLDGGECGAVTASVRRTFPAARVVPISAHTGAGVAELIGVWNSPAHRMVASPEPALDIDYDRYAAAEAELGWLNATVRVRAEDGDGLRPGPWIRWLLTGLSDACARRGWPIGHLKASVRTHQGWTQASVIRAGEPPVFRAEQEERSDEGELLINVRARAAPEELDHVTRELLSVTDAALSTVSTVDRLDAFSPAYPTPTHRLAG